MDFLRELIKIKEGFMPDFDSMSDEELKQLCMDLEAEDLCELDDEGNIINRERLIRDLQAGHGGGDVDIPMESKTDPVGKEDCDVDNDGDSDKSDAYLMRRRQKIAASKKKQVKEAKIIKHRGKPMTNVRKSFNYMKPVKEAKAPVMPSPSHGGKQGNVSNKSAKQAVQDEIGNGGMKGMKKKDRPYMEKPRFRDWLTANMFFTMTKSGELAGKMKLGESEEKEYEVFGYYVSRQDGKNYRRTFKASSPEEAREKALKNLHGMAANKANRITRKSIKIKDVREVKKSEA